MAVRLSRFFVICLVVIVAAVYLPYYYQITFSKRVVPPIVRYSPVINNFVIARYGINEFTWYDQQGNIYTRSDADRLLPFINYRLLAARGIMPDSLGAHELNFEEVKRNNIYMKIRPRQIDLPKIEMYPLFESNPPRLQLEMPWHFFRITGRMEFIDSRSNTIDEELTARFTRCLQNSGFSFPARSVFGNPTTRKPFDEGYFVVDRAEQCFHIKMINGQPLCRNLNLPDSIRVKAIFVKENDLREFYGILLDRQDRVYLILYDHYRLQQLPVGNYDSANEQFLLYGTLKNRLMLTISDNTCRASVADRNYRLIDTYEEKWTGYDQQQASLIAKYIFPFVINLSGSGSLFVNMNFTDYNVQALFLNGLFLIAFLLFKKWKEQRWTAKWYDLLIVLVTGIYGFIAVLIFENTDAF